MKYVKQITLVIVLLLAGFANASAKFDVVVDGLKGPENLVFDDKGSLYLTETDHLWKISADGKKESIYSRDPKVDGKSLCGVCIGPNGKIYFSASNRILILDPANNSVTELVNGFKLANGVCMDDKGNLFIADMTAKTLFAVPAGKKIAVPVAEHVGMINGVKWDSRDNTIYYTNSAPGKLCGIQLSNMLTPTKKFNVARFPFVFLDDFALDSEGNFYVCEWKGGKIVRVDRNGKKQVVVKGIDGPSAVAFGVGPMAGKLFICVKGGSFKFKGTQLVTFQTKAAGRPLPFAQ